MRYVDINCDLGESFGHYKLGDDAKIIPYATSVNIACGFHAGDPVVMRDTVCLAKKYGKDIGAHPGFCDLMGFGRRRMNLSPSEVEAYVMYQIGALSGFCNSMDVRLSHVKAHGELYNWASVDREIADAFCRAVKKVGKGTILLALAGSVMVDAARQIGLRVKQEAFVDRGYERDGTLVSRGKSGSVLEMNDASIDRVVRMVNEGKVAAVTGEDIDICVDSLCIHGDGSQAFDFIACLRERLSEHRINIFPMSAHSE